MELSFEKIKSAVFGACRVIERDGLIEMLRFDKSQDEFLSQNPDQVTFNFRKSKSTSSVVMDFYSDTEWLKMDLATFVSSTQSSCYVDVFVNGSICAHEGYTGLVDGKISLDLKIKGREKKRITVYFPTLFQACIKSVSIADGAIFEPAVVGKTFYFIGDSITCGYTSDFPSLTYANIIAREYDAHAYNHSIGGAFFNEHTICDCLPVRPNVIFVAYGTNDWSKNGDLEVNSLKFAKRLAELYPDIKIVCITPIWRGGIAEKEKETKTSFNRAVEMIKKNFKKFSNVTVVDGIDLVPHNTQYFIADVLHPNALGFIEYAKNLKAKLDNLDIIK